MLKSVVISLHSLSTRWKETDPARRHKRILIFVLLALHVLPLWIFTYFPSQDGPAHIYNAYVLKVFHDAKERVSHKTVLPVESHAFSQLVLACFHDVINVYCAAFSSRKNPFKPDYCFVSVVAFLFS